MGGTCPGSDGLGTCPAWGLMEQAWTAVSPSHEPLGTVGGGVPPAGPSLQGQQVGYALGSKVSSEVDRQGARVALRRWEHP